MPSRFSAEYIGGTAADLAEEARQCRDAPRSRRNRDRTAFQHPAFGIGRVGGDAELHRGHISLVGMEQFAGKLGRLAEAQGQQAGGQGVERAGMAGLVGIEQATRRLQGA